MATVLFLTQNVITGVFRNVKLSNCTGEKSGTVLWRVTTFLQLIMWLCSLAVL